MIKYRALLQLFFVHGELSGSAVPDIVKELAIHTVEQAILNLTPTNSVSLHTAREIFIYLLDVEKFDHVKIVNGDTLNLLTLAAKYCKISQFRS